MIYAMVGQPEPSGEEGRRIGLFQFNNKDTPLLRNNNCIPGGGGIVHFNNVLGVTASILIKSSGRNLSHYLSSGELEKCSSTGVYSY